MLNTRNMLVGTIVLAAAANAFGQTGYIQNSKHNFSSYAWSGNEICKPCHTPHFANKAAGRLWNHTLSTATYTLFDGTAGTSADFDRESRLCLSCHDGTVALDSFGGQTGTNFINGDENLGTDLTNDHPVGSDAEYPPDPPPSWWSHAFRDEASLPSAIRLKNWVNDAGATRKVVGCTTCHDEHNAGGYEHMLVMSNAASAICLGCHIK